MSDELSERDYETMLDTIRTASEWHGGQWSALYSYSSTGEIHDKEHKADLLRELDDCEGLATDVANYNSPLPYRSNHSRPNVSRWSVPRSSHLRAGWIARHLTPK